MSLLSDKDYISFKSIAISFIEIDKNTTFKRYAIVQTHII